jgi:hypothetical protein
MCLPAPSPGSKASKALYVPVVPHLVTPSLVQVSLMFWLPLVSPFGFFSGFPAGDSCRLRSGSSLVWIGS